MMVCRKTYLRAVPLDRGGIALLRLKCRSKAFDDCGRCCKCGGIYGRRDKKAKEEIGR